MRISSLCVVSLLAAALLGSYGCSKINGINNNQVIQTPYSLYFSDTAGALFNTNDGKTFNSFVFPPDGKPCRAICVSGNNILFVKDNLYYSSNNGKNFNHTYDTLAQNTRIAPCTNSRIMLNQSMIINIPEWNNRVYCVSISPDVNRNWLGIIHSDNNGNPRTWALDGSYDTSRPADGHQGIGVGTPQSYSFTLLPSGKLCALAYTTRNYIDPYHVRNFFMDGKDGRWTENTANPDGISYLYQVNLTGTPLPPYGATYTDTSFFTLGHFNERLIAIDQSCKYGAWYSDDVGANWQPYNTGLPANTSLLCIASPFEEICLIGTAGKGLYILNTHTGSWERNNKGLGSDLIVRNIAFKQNVFKNGTLQRYIYLATNKGIYQSTDGGLNWTMTIAGNYVAVY